MDDCSEPGLISMSVRLSKVLHRRMSEELLGMSLRLFMALSYIRDHQGVSQQELGEALYMDPNNLVLLLNQLEAAGQSVRRRDPVDRRRHLVELTDAGRAALERAERAREGIENEALTALTPEERATLRSLLSRVLDSLNRPTEVAGRR